MNSRGLEPNYIFEINDTSTVLDLVQAGFGVALVPEIIADLKSSLRRIPLKGRRWNWTIVAETLGPAPRTPPPVPCGGCSRTTVDDKPR